MEKWADYLIFKVKYNEGHTHIEKVCCFHDNGDTIGKEILFSRDEIINSINRGKKFITIFKSDKKWKKGQPVEIVTIDTDDYIKTMKNDKTCNNLENLPEF